MVKRFANDASIFYFNLSSPSSIATCTALLAIRRFRRQYGSRRSDSDKYALLLYFHVTGKCKHLCLYHLHGYRMQNWKKSGKIKLQVAVKYLLAAYRESLIALRAITKGNL
jgi:hypothetical protein